MEFRSPVSQAPENPHNISRLTIMTSKQLTARNLARFLSSFFQIRKQVSKSAIFLKQLFQDCISPFDSFLKFVPRLLGKCLDCFCIRWRSAVQQGLEVEPRYSSVCSLTELGARRQSQDFPMVDVLVAPFQTMHQTRSPFETWSIAYGQN